MRRAISTSVFAARDTRRNRELFVAAGARQYVAAAQARFQTPCATVMISSSPASGPICSLMRLNRARSSNRMA